MNLKIERKGTPTQVLIMILHLINHSNTASKKLSEREINLLAFFMLLPEKFKYNRFSSLAKDYVVKMAVENG